MERKFMKKITGIRIQMRRVTAVFPMLFLLSVCVAAIIQGEAVAWEKVNSGASCIGENCHNAMGHDKFVHGPVAVGECTICHVPTDRHKFTTLEGKDSTCYICHDTMSSQDGIHNAVKNGKCTECHDAHQSSNRFRIRSNRVMAGLQR